MEVLFHASHIALHISIFKHKIRTLVSTKYHNSTCRGIHNIVSISTHIHVHTVHKQCTHCTQTAAITLEPLAYTERGESERTGESHNGQVQEEPMCHWTATVELWTKSTDSTTKVDTNVHPHNLVSTCKHIRFVHVCVCMGSPECIYII